MPAAVEAAPPPLLLLLYFHTQLQKQKVQYIPLLAGATVYNSPKFLADDCLKAFIELVH